MPRSRPLFCFPPRARCAPQSAPAALIAFSALLLAGCPSYSRSSLGQGSFSVTCADADALCPEAGAQLPLHKLVAVDSTLEIAFTGEQVTESAISVRPVSPLMAQQDGLLIRFTAAGYCGLLARSEAGTVVDLEHVQVVPVHHLTVLGSPTLAVGDSTMLRAEPHGEQDDLLGGSLSYVWITSDPSVVAIDTSAHGSSVKVLAVGAGVATVRAAAGAIEYPFELTVTEAP